MRTIRNILLILAIAAGLAAPSVLHEAYRYYLNLHSITVFNY